MKKPIRMPCQHCGKPKGEHKAGNLACPFGRRHGKLGYLSFHSDNFYTPPKDKISVNTEQKQMIKIIKKIGKALGWNPMPYADGAAVQFGSGTVPEIVWPTDPIKFAAYAKAEIAKRGWVFHISGSIVCAAYIDKRTDFFPFDRKCPISESTAVISCCSHALTLLAKMEKSGDRSNILLNKLIPPPVTRKEQ